MKITDITNGDWVKVIEGDNEYIGQARAVNSITNYCIVFVGGDGHGSDHDVFIEDIQPIRLSQEILEKNGFFYDDKNYILSYKEGAHDVALYISQMYMAPGFVTGTPDLNSKKPYSLNVFGTLHYVHELQHLFKFLKIKKEIVL